jgi:hypothetical protein
MKTNCGNNFLPTSGCSGGGIFKSNKMKFLKEYESLLIGYFIIYILGCVLGADFNPFLWIFGVRIFITCVGLIWALMWSGR